MIGYYFQCRIEECKQRNLQRPADRVIPLPGLLGTYARLVPPSKAEGLSELYCVRINAYNGFDIEKWADGVRRVDEMTRDFESLPVDPGPEYSVRSLSRGDAG